MTREITQPDGPSSIVDGWKVQWQKWSMRVGFNPREGITLHEITYTDRGETRPIIYRASLSEMVVPYGDTRPAHWNKNVFDMGEVGMGFSANPLTLGCDCLGEIYYDDGTVNDSSGNAVTIPNVICMHEEDYGISWEHIDFRTGEVEVRNDASMEVEVKLSGVLTTGAVPDGEEPRWGKLVAPNIPEPDPELNPHHNAWVTRDTLMASEADGARDWSRGRYWKITNRPRRTSWAARSPTS
jgi:primary-amine oxidase